MRKNLSKGVMLIQKFAEKYANVILQKLNIKPKKTIDKRKNKKKKKKKETNNKGFQFIKKKQDQNEEHKKEKKKKIDEYLMNQEKELDFQQNYSFCNKIFFNETDNFFCNSDEENTPNILKEKHFNKQEETGEEQTGNISTDSERGSLNPFHFKFHLENDKNKEENLFLFQNDDQFSKQKKKQKVKQEEEEKIETKLESEWLPENYVWYLAEKEENKQVSDIQFPKSQNNQVGEKSFFSGNICHDVKIYEENQTYEMETNKRKRKLELKLENEFDTNLQKSKKENVLVNRNNLNNVKKTAIMENNESETTMNNNNNSNDNDNNNNRNDNDNNNNNNNIRSKDTNIHCATTNVIKINDTNEQREIGHSSNKQNKLGFSDMKYNLVFENYNFENLIKSPEKNEMEPEKIEKEEEYKENENKKYGTNVEGHETKEEPKHVENQRKQGTSDSFLDSYNEIQITGDNVKNNTAKSDNANQDFVMKEYKDDFALFEDLNEDTSLELFFIDSQDPPSIFKT